MKDCLLALNQLMGIRNHPNHGNLTHPFILVSSVNVVKQYEVMISVFYTQLCTEIDAYVAE